MLDGAFCVNGVVFIVGRLKLGMLLPVLVEEVNRQDGTMVSGRLTNNTLVHFPGKKELIGSIVPVKLMESRGFYYIGEQA